LLEHYCRSHRTYYDNGCIRSKSGKSHFKAGPETAVPLILGFAKLFSLIFCVGLKLLLGGKADTYKLIK